MKNNYIKKLIKKYNKDFYDNVIKIAFQTLDITEIIMNKHKITYNDYIILKKYYDFGMRIKNIPEKKQLILIRKTASFN